MSPATAAPKRAKSASKTASRPAAPAPSPPPSSPPSPPPAARMPPVTWAPAPAPASAPMPPARGGFAPGQDMGTGAADFWRGVYEVARKDLLQHIRTKRLLIIGLFFFLSLQLVTLVLPNAFDNPAEPEPGDPSNENLFIFVHLNASIFGGLFAIQLLCIVLTADAVCSEWSGRTIFLMLSKPVSRTAFVVGKYLGSVASIVPTVALLYSLQYLIMMGVYPGQPSGSEVLGFVKMLGMLSIGAMAVAAVALFFSTLTRSNVQSLVLTLLSVFILFPIIGAIGDIQFIVDAEKSSGDDESPDPEDWKYDWSHYVSPERAMGAAGQLLFPDQDEDDDFSFTFSFLVPQFAPQRTWMAVLSGLAFIAVFVGSSILRVQTRNFE